MSNGLHHVAPASFFPTAKELSSGLQWFKEHPILAAAAATAVSVITYLHTAEDDDVDASAADAAALAELLSADVIGDSPSMAQAAKAPSALDAPPPPPPRRHASSPSVLSTSDAASRASPSPPPRRASTPVPGRVTPPALRKPGSEGKMSPAAVTWVDEHGGSLTQVFEHLAIEHDDDDDEHEHDRSYPDLDGPQGGPGGGFRATPRRKCPPPTPRRNIKSTDEEIDSDLVEETSASTTSDHWMGRIGIPSPQLATGVATPSDRPTTESPSPQWGWYVPITPPQDHLTGGVAGPPPSSSAATRSAAAMAVATVVHAEDSATVSSAMRRSASGRIKAA